MERDGAQFLLPYVVGATALLGGLAALELASRGQIRSADNSADIYFALIGAYATAGEIKRWMDHGAGASGPGAEASPEDPWLARARKGGLFVGFWLFLYTAALLWRVADPSVPMPHELKSLTLRTISVFFVAYSSRRLRRGRVARLGAAGTEAATDSVQPPDTEERLISLLKIRPEGLSRREISDRFPDESGRTMTRVLARLLALGKLQRRGHAKSPECRYAVGETVAS